MKQTFMTWSLTIDLPAIQQYHQMTYIYLKASSPSVVVDVVLEDANKQNADSFNLLQTSSAKGNKLFPIRKKRLIFTTKEHYKLFPASFNNLFLFPLVYFVYCNHCLVFNLQYCKVQQYIFSTIMLFWCLFILYPINYNYVLTFLSRL